MGPGPLDRVRQICLSLPEASERLSHGEPTWFAGGRKAFVMYADRHHDSRVALWAAAPEGVQGQLVGQDPEHFFVPPYVGVRGWLGVYLDLPIVDWPASSRSRKTRSGRWPSGVWSPSLTRPERSQQPVYRASGGRAMGSPVRGVPVLLLTVAGCKSGVEHTAVSYFEDAGRFVGT